MWLPLNLWYSASDNRRGTAHSLCVIPSLSSEVYVWFRSRMGGLALAAQSKLCAVMEVLCQLHQNAASLRPAARNCELPRLHHVCAEATLMKQELVHVNKAHDSSPSW